MFVSLVLAGILAHGCSDNNGRVTSTKSPTTGFANTSAEIRVQVAINPNTITPGQRAGVTAIVTNLNGHPLAGKKVQFSTDVGSLDVTVGTTNAQGLASTFLRISAADVANLSAPGSGAPGGTGASPTFAIVTAFVEGAVGTGQVFVGGVGAPPAPPPPLPFVISPATVTKAFGADAGGPPFNTCTNVGNFTIQFTVAGGVPGYTFTTAGTFGGAVSPTGLYTAPAAVGPVGVGFTTTETVTVVDSAGNLLEAIITISCTAPAP